MASVAAGYLPILLFLIIALGLSTAFVVLPMLVARLTGAHKPDPAKLSDAWYSFRPSAELNLDSLPYTVDGRRVTLSRFSELLQEAHRQAPDLSLVWETGQRDWTEHLIGLGLDPELFRYQRSMNAGEGEAAEASWRWHLRSFRPSGPVPSRTGSRRARRA